MTSGARDTSATPSAGEDRVQDEHHRRWEQILVELEDQLDELAWALETGAPVPATSWRSPGDLGPPPEHLEPRAQAVAVRMTHLRRRADARLAELGDELRGLGRRRQAGATYASEATR